MVVLAAENVCFKCHACISLHLRLSGWIVLLCSYEEMENWKQAAQQAYLLAQVQHALGHTAERDMAADKWQVLTDLADRSGDTALRLQ